MAGAGFGSFGVGDWGRGRVGFKGFQGCEALVEGFDGGFEGVDAGLEGGLGGGEVCGTPGSGSGSGRGDGAAEEVGVAGLP